MVRASDCGPEGRRFDPDIPPHVDMGIKKSRPVLRVRFDPDIPPHISGQNSVS